MNTNDIIISEVPLYAIVDNRLQRVQATREEIVLGTAVQKYLSRLLRMFAKNGSRQRIKTKLMGDMVYWENTVGRGKRRVTQHYLTFTDEVNVLMYEEMRHAVQIAIWLIVGEPVSLTLDLEKRVALWVFSAGGKMSDVVRS